MASMRKSKEEKYIECVGVYLTKKQKIELERKALEEDIPISNYIRRILFPIKEED
ncbi:MAG: hypothetical protein ACFFCV_02510 [Promethearchaeota archaeon]